MADRTVVYSAKMFDLLPGDLFALSDSRGIVAETVTPSGSDVTVVGTVGYDPAGLLGGNDTTGNAVTITMPAVYIFGSVTRLASAPPPSDKVTQDEIRAQWDQYGGELPVWLAA